MDFSTIRPFQYVALRLPNDQTRLERLNPNSPINLGKYGSFHSNQLFGRPYHLTFEILDKSESRDDRELRVIPAAELHASALLEEAEGEDSVTPNGEVDEYGLPTGNKSNVNITDDPTNQRLTMEEIEELKQDEMGTTKDLIAKIMSSHSTLDQKTAFSLAKYTLRKNRKYMKRFTVLPLDVPTLTDFIMVEKDFTKIMEIRNEILGLIGCWANVHASGDPLPIPHPISRYLVVDDTGGLVLSAMAERMGILHQANPSSSSQPDGEDSDAEQQPPLSDAPPTSESTSISAPSKPRRQGYLSTQMSSLSNSLTLIHSNQQPNLSLLRYFNYDANNPTPTHPLYTHLKTLSWLQLLSPHLDSAYTEPPLLSPEQLSKLKSNPRSNYHRKRRRWGRAKAVIDETRSGGFDGLVVASWTDPTSILGHLVPLLSGGAQVVVVHPNVEPLLGLTDCYSTARRTAFLNRLAELEDGAEGDEGQAAAAQQDVTNGTGKEALVPSEDFPVDPTLLLAPSVQTSRVRAWQVLPGRTHPLMTSKGGAEGYVWTATRVNRAEGRVAARGKGRRNQNRKQAVGGGAGSGEATPGVEGTVEREEDVRMGNDEEGEGGEEGAGVDGPEKEAKLVKLGEA